VAAIEAIDSPFRAQLRSRFASSPGISCPPDDRLPACPETKSTNHNCHNRVNLLGVSRLGSPWSNMRATGEKNEKA
jgi:hypothetical protein